MTTVTAFDVDTAPAFAATLSCTASAYDVSGAAPLGLAPTIENYDPDPSTGVFRGDHIAFDVNLHGVALRRLVVLAIMRGRSEVVFGAPAGAFGPEYAKGSTLIAISTGYRMEIRRFALWPDTPHFEIVAINVEGSEAP